MAPNDPNIPNAPSVGYLIADLTRLFGRVFDRRAAHLGLTRVQWRSLKRIHDNEGLTQSGLADLLDMEPIAVGRVIDRLQKAGFVERRADPDDRRCWRLYLLPQSMQVMDGIGRVSIVLREDATHGVDPGDYETTMRVLEQMRDNLIRLDRESRGEATSRKA
ncbi:MAG: MarR family transcriptional regulator [Luteimonas sp.]|nr:MarR family transcriptional regulator [Luteimonas sp.]